MHFSLLGFVIVQSLYIIAIRCQGPPQDKPEWVSPTSGDYYLHFYKPSTCNGASVLALSAKPTTEVRYRIVSQTPDDGVFFTHSVEPEPGEPKLNDLKCFSSEAVKAVKYTVVLGAYIGPLEDGNESTVTLTFLVLRAQPQLKFTSPKDGAKININETSAVNSTIAAFEALDTTGMVKFTDTLIYTIVSQEPANPVKFFVKDKTLLTKETFNVDVKDAVQAYTLIIKVEDADENAQDDTINVTINIKDRNTQAPKFETEMYTDGFVVETAKIGQKVLNVTATDDDLTEINNKVTYTLKESTEPFSIDNSTGEIKVAGKLSYANKPLHTLTVIAKDNGGKSASVTIYIHIFTAPKFTNPKDGDTIILNENTRIGTLFEKLEVWDEDSNFYDEFSSSAEKEEPIYTLVSQDPADPEMFLLRDNLLETIKAFNVDVKDPVLTYTLTLKVTDGNEYTEDDIITVTIKINDSNTQSPIFKTGVSYEASVKETAEIGQKVLTVTATDDDLTELNNKVTYSLQESMKAFSIDESSGEIKVAEKLSYESKSLYELTVKAEDNGGKSATQTVKITIQSTEPPKFENIAEGESTEIKENADVGTSVFKVSVLDVSDTWDKVIEIENQSPKDSFRMEGDLLKTNTNNFDADIPTKYEVTFKVTDRDITVTSNKLTVNILDVNDNKPVVTKIEDVTLPENLLIDEVVVYGIEATDNDVSEPNNVLLYTITSGNDGDTFKIDKSSGKIQLNTQLSKLTYTLEVTVSDKGEPVLSETTEVKINVDSGTIDECADIPCKNGATCSSSVNMYTCKCVPGFEGENCNTNINECEPNPCLNGGTCSDGINMFTCDCAQGWQGYTCSSSCTGNKYGKNCEQSCNCNVTRLIEDVEDQQCDTKDGTCKCNTNYVGDSCEDRDECTENENICGREPHVVCENTVGSYSCICEQFYREESNRCTRYEEDKTVEFEPATERILQADMVINERCQYNLTFPSGYSKTKRNIENMARSFLPASKSCTAVNIRCGSLLYELIIVVDIEKASELANELSSAVNNGIIYDGRKIEVYKLDVNGEDVKSLTSGMQRTCAVYNAIEKCSSGYSCRIENGEPRCQKEEDNLSLILGLGLGVCLPLLLMAVTAAACLYRYVRKAAREEKGRSTTHSDSIYRKELSPWHGQMLQNGLRLDTRYYGGYDYVTDRYGDSFSRYKKYDLPGLSYTSS